MPSAERRLVVRADLLGTKPWFAVPVNVHGEGVEIHLPSENEQDTDGMQLYFIVNIHSIVVLNSDPVSRCKLFSLSSSD